jgi:dienelactone hydrolase
MRAPPLIAGVLLCGALAQTLTNRAQAQDQDVDRGTARFVALDKEKCPKLFRLEDHEFDYQVRWRDFDSPRYELADVTFPSPVKTPHERNNTVHCELYRPKHAGKRPAVIVLHILGGDFALARLFCHSLNQGGTTALFLKMPYYGPRREPGVNRRMIAEDPEETVAGMTQAVLDIRRAAAFLASRDDVDPEQIGILGVSLGGITASLAAEAEPRIQNVCLLLAGGDFPKIAAESAEFKKERERFLASGKDPSRLLEGVRQVDPLTYAELLRDRRVLMLNAKSDEVIPRACTESLWTAAGKPEIIWLSGGHYSVMRHLPTALIRANHFFAVDGSAKDR